MGLFVELNSAHDTWDETVLHNFCAQANCTDGNFPWGRLTIDSSGNLYGTTSAGGTGSHSACGGNDSGCGVAFERAAGGAFSVIYNFCSLTQCTDGYDPQGGLIVDRFGDLFAMTLRGGEPDNGVFYELAKNGGSWNESVLYTFCTQNCKDGSAPEGGLLTDAAGNFWGTTFGGGKHFDGNAFEFTP